MQPYLELRVTDQHIDSFMPRQDQYLIQVCMSVYVNQAEAMIIRVTTVQFVVPMLDGLFNHMDWIQSDSNGLYHHLADASGKHLLKKLKIFGLSHLSLGGNEYPATFLSRLSTSTGSTSPAPGLRVHAPSRLVIRLGAGAGIAP